MSLGNQPPRAIGSSAEAEKTPPPAQANACKLCTSITADSVEGCVREIAKAAGAGVDVVELRLDYLETSAGVGKPDLATLIEACDGSGVSCIVTFRPSWEGGRYEGAEDARIETLRSAADCGAHFVDLEFKLGPEKILSFKNEFPATKVIVSDHNYEVTPPTADLVALVSSIKACGADVVKIATTAQSTGDAFRMLQLARNESSSGQATITLAMGEAGLPSRLLAPKYGAFLTFGALTAGSESAPGQPALSDMTQVYRLKHQTPDTLVFGVIGDPIKHSMSPVIHNAAFASQGLNAVYLPFLVHSVDDFMATFREHEFSGCSVTIPHKEQVGRYCEEVDSVAGKIGAINTIIAANEGGEVVLRASNTDWVAAIAAIEGAMGGEGTLKGEGVCILGSGGTARALAFGALAKGAGMVTIANRTLSKAENLAGELGCEARSLADLEADEGLSGKVLINTTSVGMSGPNVEASPVTQGVVDRFDLVFDAIYNPLETRLLAMARGSGKATVSGVEMFIGQAAEQFKQFSGSSDVPVDLMRAKVMERLSK